MNNFEMYDKYCEQRTNEFKGLLKGVSREVLLMTEKISKDVVRKNLRSNGLRRSIYCGGVHEDGKDIDGCLEVAFDTEEIGLFPYNDTAEKDLNKFMEAYYPGIVCIRYYSLDLYDRKFTFYFVFNVKYSDEDFDWQTDDIGILKEGEVNINSSVELFTDDIAEILQCKFTTNNWESLETYKKRDRQGIKKTDVYYRGSVYFDIPIEW